MDTPMTATQTQHKVTLKEDWPTARVAKEKAKCLLGIQCCVRDPEPHRFSSIASSILPAALLLFLPKCPLCLAAWLTVATGVSFPLAGVAWLRGTLVLLWAVVMLAMIWRRVFRRRWPSPR
jgi:hypothetical protein